MALVYKGEGRIWTFTAGDTVTAGDLPCLHTDDAVYSTTNQDAEKCVGVCIVGGDSGAKVSIATEGVFTLSTDGSGTMVAGQPIIYSTKTTVTDAGSDSTAGFNKIGRALGTADTSSSADVLIRV
jgi:predicted RecA/RadA family phage recombinase